MRLAPRHSACERRRYPAWVDAEQGASFAVVVMPRVRDGLVLRLVAKRKSVDDRLGGRGRKASDALAR